MVASHPAPLRRHPPPAQGGCPRPGAGLIRLSLALERSRPRDASVPTRAVIADTAAERAALRATLGAIAALSLFRLFGASRVGLGDAEAYYWSWSEQLAAGYLDHGPVIAWLIRVSTTLVGQTPLGVRAACIAVSALTLWIVAHTAARVGGSRRNGLLACLLLAGMPAFIVAGGAANPDVPFLFFVALFSWILLDRARRTSARWVALAGLVAGLAVSTKLFGLALVFSLYVLLWRDRAPARHRVLALLASALGASPFVIWNVQHDWPTLRYHLVSRHAGTPIGLSLLNLAKLIGGQVGYISPLILALIGVSAVRAVRLRSRCGREQALLALPLVAGGSVLIALVPSAEPHWPAAGYLPLLVGAAEILRERLSEAGSRRLIRAAMACSGLFFLAFHVHVLTDVGVRLMPSSYIPRYDLSNELVGWDRVAERVAALTGGRAGRSGEHELTAVSAHYTSCSQLRFAAAGRFPVDCLSGRLDQFDFAVGSKARREMLRQLIYVWDERFPFEARELYRCERTRELAALEVVRAGRIVRRFRFASCEGYGGLATESWPPHRAPKEY